MKTRVTVESLTAELDEAIALAKRVDQPGAMTQAVTVKGKLHGLLIDRKESGQPGDFAAAQSAQEVIDAVRKELGEDAARALQALAGLHPAEQAGPDEPAESGQGLGMELATPTDKIN